MIKIYAINQKTLKRIEVKDFYWFEEQGIHDFSGEGHYDNYKFEIEIQETIPCN
jgi:hypothetical protein